jgi:hypothetical protein
LIASAPFFRKNSARCRVQNHPVSLQLSKISSGARISATTEPLASPFYTTKIRVSGS